MKERERLVQIQSRGAVEQRKEGKEGGEKEIIGQVEPG